MKRMRIHLQPTIRWLPGILLGYLLLTGWASARTTVTVLQNGLDLYEGCEDAEAYDDPDYQPTAGLVGVGERTGQAHPHYLLIRFRDIARMLNTTTIEKAELQLYLVAEESRVPAFISTFRVLQNWDESYLEQSLDGWYTYQEGRHWNGPGLTVANNIASEDSFADRAYIPMPQTVVAEGAGRWYAWDITEAVRRWYDGSWKEYGIVLTGASVANSFKQFASSEYSDPTLRPRLVITHNPQELIGEIFARQENAAEAQTIFRPGDQVIVTARSANGLSGYAATVRVQGPGYDTGLQAMDESPQPGEYEFRWTTDGLPSGEYQFTIRFVNPETQQRDTVSDFVLTLDADPPTGGSLQINQGASATTSRDVTLQITVDDAVEMQLTGDLEQPPPEWIPVVNTLNARLTEGDGLKRIQVEFRDAAGNVSDPVEASIVLDETPVDVLDMQSWNASDPEDADHIYRTGQRVVIQIQTEEGADLQQASLRITGNGFDSGDLALQVVGPNTLQYAWDTSSLSDGVYRVQASLKDAFGRVSLYPPPGAPEFTITLDSQPPLNPQVIVLDAGVQTRTRTVSLGLEAQGATQMFLSGDLLDEANTFEWIPYASQTQVHLVGEDGPKRIVAQFRDAAGNETTPVETSIRLEVQPPRPLDYGTLVLHADRSGTLTLFFDEPLKQVQPEIFQVTLHNEANDQEIFILTPQNAQVGVDGERLWVQIPGDNPLSSWTLSEGGNLLLWAEVAPGSVLDAAGNANGPQDPSLRIQVQILNPGQLGGATATPSIISPNGDGVQDGVLIQYTLLQNGTVWLKVEDNAGALVYEQSFPNQRRGQSYQIEWEGTGQGNTPVSDGQYFLSLVLEDPVSTLKMPLVERFGVTVDTQPPVIEDPTPVSGAEIPPNPVLSVVVREVGSALKAAYLTVDQGLTRWDLQPLDGRYQLAAGSVTLAPGNHTLHFHAEDQAGNHTRLSVSYSVVTSATPILQFYNFPNPFPAGTTTSLVISLGQPITGGHLRIYDGAGNLVYTVDLKDVGLTPREYRIPWDGRSLYGDLLARGVYFAVLSIESDAPDLKRAERIRHHRIAIW